MHPWSNDNWIVWVQASILLFLIVLVYFGRKDASGIRRSSFEISESKNPTKITGYTDNC